MLEAACLKPLTVQRFQGGLAPQARSCYGNRTRRWPLEFVGRRWTRLKASCGCDRYLQPLSIFRASENLQEETCLDELRLEKIQQPSQVERLLETFATRSGLLPQTAYRVRDPQALPEKLQRLIIEAIAHAWLCFSQGSRFWLFTGMVSRALSLERNARCCG